MITRKNLKILFICLFSMVMISGCSIIKLSREKFKSILESEKYQVKDETNSVNDSYIKSYDFAKNVNNETEIKYYIFQSNKYAKNFFDETKEKMKEESNRVSSDTNAVNWINYTSFITRTNDNYKRVIKKYNTVIIIETTAVNTSKAMKIAEKLGY